MEKNNVIQNAHSVILSAHHVILSVAKNLFLIVIAANLLASCQKAGLIDIQGGEDVEEETLTALPAITFRAVNTTDDVVKINILEGNSATIDLFAHTSKPYSVSQNIVLDIDEAFVGRYNDKYKKNCQLLPLGFYRIGNSGSIILSGGEQESETCRVELFSVNLGNKLEEGSYVLPIAASTGDKKLNTIITEITISAPFSGRPDLYTGPDCFTVFYLNTSVFDPRLTTDFVVQKLDASWEPVWHNAIGNIVNFRIATIGLDKSESRPILNLSSDLRYLCDNYSTFFQPIKDTGRKLCLCIEGGNAGIGFCNMTDNQISDFSNQVKQVVELYGFDGVNLWDRKSGYGKEGFPDMNTTSYPKLIKVLREVLGPYKLITVADYDTPTEYFWDTEAMDGIEVGKYLDYAWSGYVNGDEPVQIIDPYHQDNEFVSKKYPRKPIVGLSSDRYGCVHTTWYENGKSGYEDVSSWAKAGLKSNNISVYYDIRSNLQDKFEGQIYTPQQMLEALDEDGSVYSFDIKNFKTEGSGYGKWLKNW